VCPNFHLFVVKKGVFSPTVPKNKERLCFCLHSYNSSKEISEVLSLLAIFTNTEFKST
tara:strand:- start:1014 stop:1187 length:174 start_codon:yes stop_codon:yes gene_type:complete